MGRWVIQRPSDACNPHVAVIERAALQVRIGFASGYVFKPSREPSEPIATLSFRLIFATVLALGPKSQKSLNPDPKALATSPVRYGMEVCT